MTPPREAAASIAEMRDRPEDGALVIQISRHTWDTCLDVADAYLDMLARGDPQWDGTDAAHPAWWRGNDRGVEQVVERLTEVLDGKDNGSGVLNFPPLESLRRRLLGILARGPGVTDAR